MKKANERLTALKKESLGASALLGSLAKEKNDDANGLCDGTSCRDLRGVTSASDVRSF